MPVFWKSSLICALILIFSISVFAQSSDQCDAMIEAKLMDYLEIDNLSDLFDYLDSLSEPELDEIFDAIDLTGIEEDCANGEAPQTSDPKSPSSTDLSSIDVTAPSFIIEKLPDSYPAEFSVFTKHIDVFGLHIVATADVADQKMIHAAHVFAEYLDNDEDSLIDNPLVHQALLEAQATIIMFAHENADFERFVSADHNHDIEVQPLFDREVHLENGLNGEFDATLEEILHLITSKGYSEVYSEIWGEDRNSTIAITMEKLIADGNYNPEANEPNLPYPVMVTEYIYWVTTSLAGAQMFDGRGDQISNEWALNTPAKLEASAPEVVALLNHEEYGLPLQMPDGNYDPKVD